MYEVRLAKMTSPEARPAPGQALGASAAARLPASCHGPEGTVLGERLPAPHWTLYVCAAVPAPQAGPAGRDVPEAQKAQQHTTAHAMGVP